MGCKVYFETKTAQCLQFKNYTLKLPGQKRNQPRKPFPPAMIEEFHELPQAIVSAG